MSTPVPQFKVSGGHRIMERGGLLGAMTYRNLVIHLGYIGDGPNVVSKWQANISNIVAGWLGSLGEQQAGYYTYGYAKPKIEGCFLTGGTTEAARVATGTMQEGIDPVFNIRVIACLSFEKPLIDDTYLGQFIQELYSAVETALNVKAFWPETAIEVAAFTDKESALLYAAALAGAWAKLLNPDLKDPQPAFQVPTTTTAETVPALPGTTQIGGLLASSPLLQAAQSEQEKLDTLIREKADAWEIIAQRERTLAAQARYIEALELAVQQTQQAADAVLAGDSTAAAGWMRTVLDPALQENKEMIDRVSTKFAEALVEIEAMKRALTELLAQVTALGVAGPKSPEAQAGAPPAPEATKPGTEKIDWKEYAVPMALGGVFLIILMRAMLKR